MSQENVLPPVRCSHGWDTMLVRDEEGYLVPMGTDACPAGCSGTVVGVRFRRPPPDAKNPQGVAAPYVPCGARANTGICGLPSKHQAPCLFT